MKIYDKVGRLGCESMAVMFYTPAVFFGSSVTRVVYTDIAGINEDFKVPAGVSRFLIIDGNSVVTRK